MEEPFTSNRHEILAELHALLKDSLPDLEYISGTDAESGFRYHLQYQPEDGSSNIGTSTLLAAWNAATYVAQIEEERIIEALSDEQYLKASENIIERNNGLWFSDESFIVKRRRT